MVIAAKLTLGVTSQAREEEFTLDLPGVATGQDKSAGAGSRMSQKRQTR